MVIFGRMPLLAAALVSLISLLLACGDSSISLISGESQQTFGSIASALEAASDGDTIVIGPGTHRETLTVTKSVTLTGDGPSDEVIIENDVGAPIWVQSEGVSLRGLTVRCTAPEVDPENDGAAIFVTQGSVSIEDCAVNATANPGLYVNGEEGGRATARNCRFETRGHSGALVQQGGVMTLEGCLFQGNRGPAVMSSGAGSRVTLRDSEVLRGTAQGVLIQDESVAVIERCHFSQNHRANINVHQGGVIEVRDCLIERSGNANVFFSEGGLGVVEDCLIQASAAPNVGFSAGANGTVRRCEIRDGGNCGILVYSEGEAHIEDCDVHHNRSTAMAVDTRARATVTNSQFHHSIESVGIDLEEWAVASFVSCEIYANRMSGVLHNETEATFRRCSIRDNGQHGVKAGSYGEALFEDCEITGNAVAGVNVVACADDTFLRTRIAGNGSTGVLGSYIGRGRFVECEIIDNGYTAAALGASSYPFFSQSRLMGGAHNAVLVLGESNPTFIGCTIGGSGWSAVASRSGGSPTLQACRIERGDPFGVRVYDEATVDLRECTFVDSRLAPMSVEPGSAVFELSAGAMRPTIHSPGVVGEEISSELTVALDGSGDFDEVGEALQVAPPGAVIRVQPGVYHDRALVLTPVTIEGVGPREQVVIVSEHGTGITVDSEDVILRGLALSSSYTKTGEDDYANGVYVIGGNALIEDCDITSAGGPPLAVGGTGTQVEVRHCLIHFAHEDGVWIGNGASATIASCEIRDNPRTGVYLVSHSLTLRDCVVTSNGAFGVVAEKGTSGQIENCDLRGNETDAIWVDPMASIEQRGNQL